ncbi:MAG: ATP cone domain-containing protein [Candidatus Pacearchaeota archaeon]|nr:ATP cone domain-containing protein [Candidatus Pacearchaeota archaeon]
MVEFPKTLDELLAPPAARAVRAVLKRDGKTITPFRPDKIAGAIRRASEASGKYYSLEFASELAERVRERLSNQSEPFGRSGRAIPTVEDVQDRVLEVFQDDNVRRAYSIIETWVESTLGIQSLSPEQVSVVAEEIVKSVDPTGSVYEQYRERRKAVRERAVTFPFLIQLDATDKQLSIHQVVNGKPHSFDTKVIASLILEKTTGVNYEHAVAAAKRVEEVLAQRPTDSSIGAEEITAIVDASLMEAGYRGNNLLGGRRLSVTLDDVNQIIYSRSVENSNIQTNNPEAVNLGIAELVLKELSMREVFEPDVAEAHRIGEIHLHDLGYPERTYCSAHSIEFLKRYGLDKVVENLDAKSHPATKPQVLNNHVHTFLAAIQSFYAGALGFPMVNTLYAPYVLEEVEMVEGYQIVRNEEGEVIKRISHRMKKTALEDILSGGEKGFEFEEAGSRRIMRLRDSKELTEIAQNLIFGASQSAFSRGGQTLFIDFNLDLGTPGHVVNVPALFGRDKRYINARKNEFGEWEIVRTDSKEPARITGLMQKAPGHEDEPDSTNGDVIQPEDGTVVLTYGHELLEKASREFARAMLRVFKAGDKYGSPFNFPKCDIHVGKTTFENPENEALLREACEVVEHNDSVYFMLDRGDGMNVAQCCRLRERITDPALLKFPEKMRFCGFQNVSINLPQTAYRATGNSLEERLASTIEEIDKTMLLALKAHTNKRRYIQDKLDHEGSPMRSMGKPSDDGEPYIDLAKATYIIGVVGLNELVQHLTGKELHENAEAFKLGLKVLSHMYGVKQEFTRRYGMKFVIEETPGESANRRLAKIDQALFPEQSAAVLKGSVERDEVYYTNSGHLNASAPVSGLDRTILQAKTNPLIEAGAITHIFSGDRQNNAGAVFDFVKAAYTETQSSQIVFSGEHTICLCCGNHVRGLKDKCGTCGNDDPKQLSQKTRIVGYNSDPRKWNRSKKGELDAREIATDYYAGGKGSLQDLEAELLLSIIEPGKTRIAIIGSEGCEQCERAYKIVERYVGTLSDEERAAVEFVRYDVANELDRVNAMIYNAPLDTFPTVVVHKGDKFKRFSSEYPYQKLPVTLNTPVLREMLEQVSAS